jgi:hypothetical protein
VEKKFGNRNLGKIARFRNTAYVYNSVPDLVGSAFNLGLDPDPYSESGSGFRIQMYKNRLKKTKFTKTDFMDENRKMLSYFFKNVLLLAIFSYLALLKSYHIEWKFFADCVSI